jgi:hypothetical protein
MRAGAVGERRAGGNPPTKAASERAEGRGGQPGATIARGGVFIAFRLRRGAAAYRHEKLAAGEGLCAPQARSARRAPRAGTLVQGGGGRRIGMKSWQRAKDFARRRRGARGERRARALLSRVAEAGALERGFWDCSGGLRRCFQRVSVLMKKNRQIVSPEQRRGRVLFAPQRAQARRDSRLTFPTVVRRGVPSCGRCSMGRAGSDGPGWRPARAS